MVDVIGSITFEVLRQRLHLLVEKRLSGTAAAGCDTCVTACHPTFRSLYNKFLTMNIDSIRADFPILSRKVNGKDLIYLDNAASTQSPRAVVDDIEYIYYNRKANVHRGVHCLLAGGYGCYGRGARTSATLYRR